MTTIKQLPPSTRPRERLHEAGSAALSDVELLAILLGTGTRSKSALALAQEILSSCKGLAGVGRLRPAELARFSGVGHGKASQILAGMELGKRVLGSRDKAPILASPEDVCAYVGPMFHGLRKEHLFALYLNAKNRLMAQELISVGTLDASHAHAREIFQGAVAIGAKSVVLAHNHPSGDPTPSEADLSASVRLKEAGRILGIHLLDHVVVGDGRHHSIFRGEA